MLFKHRNLVISASWFIMLTLGGVITDFVSDSLAYDEGNPPPSESRVAIDSDKLGGHWHGYADVAVLYNPTGINAVGGAYYRDAYRYSSKYDTVSAYWQTGFDLGINPAYAQPSVHFEWTPYLPLTLRIQYDEYFFSGMNGGLLSFSSPDEPFGSSARRARRSDEEATTGSRWMFQPALRLKYGRLVVRNQTDLAYYRFGGKGPYFLEMEYDTLLRNGDYLFANRTQTLMEVARSGDAVTWLGPFFEVVRADATKLTRKRIGLLVYTEQGPQMAFFRRTHYFAQAGYNLEDPNRGGEAFFVIGLGGDFRI